MNPKIPTDWLFFLSPSHSGCHPWETESHSTCLQLASFLSQRVLLPNTLAIHNIYYDIQSLQCRHPTHSLDSSVAVVKEQIPPPFTTHNKNWFAIHHATWLDKIITILEESPFLLSHALYPFRMTVLFK